VSSHQPPASPPGVPGALKDPSTVAAEEMIFAGSGGVAVNGYLARPSAPGSCPGIIVIHTAAGLAEHARDVTRRFANQGYIALGVDLYTREGGPPPDGDMEAIFARLFSMSDEIIFGDLEGAVDHLRSRPDVTGKVGCIGFCMGGRSTLLLAVFSDRLDAAVDCWGGFIDRATLEERSTPARPRPPLEFAEQLHCPLMAAFGVEDTNPSPRTAEELRQRLAGVPHETVLDSYEGAGHAFFADDRPTYRPEAALKLWERVIPFLARHLKGDQAAVPAG
jgi:carboxymethylenebutenolidase